jgi:hypothetical protein
MLALSASDDFAGHRFKPAKSAFMVRNGAFLSNALWAMLDHCLFFHYEGGSAMSRRTAGVSSWDRELFAVSLECVETPLRTLSIISLIIGIAYLVLAEFPDRFKKN